MWIRLGDCEYEQSDYLDDAAEYLHEMGVKAPVSVVGDMEGRSPSYHAEEPFSIYWGDEDANPVRPGANLSSRELKTLNDHLTDLERESRG